MMIKSYQYLFLFSGIVISSMLFVGIIQNSINYTSANRNFSGTNSINTSNYVNDTFHGNRLLQSGVSGTQIVGWNFANPDRWNVVNPNQPEVPAAIDGNNMLASIYRDNVYGFQYDTAEYQNANIVNGSIDAWVYSTNSFEITGVLIRAGNQNANGCYLGILDSTTLCQGYALRLYTYYAALQILNTTGEYPITTPTQYNLPGNEYYSGVWWHLRLQAIGPKIEGWVTQNRTISGPPQLSAIDTMYANGFMGLIARTQNTDPSTLQYYDAIHITTFNLIKQSESFDNGINGMQNDGWVFAYPNRWTTSTNISGIPNGNYVLHDQNNAGSSGVIYDPIQLQNIDIIDGSIEGWFYTTNQFKTGAIWVRAGIQTSGQAQCSTGFNNTGYICTGYQLLLYNDSAQLVIEKGDQIIPLQKYFTGYITNIWWHVKLQAIGTTISAWVTTSSTFSKTPIMQVTDSTYSSGYVALSARTNFASGPSYDYFDAINISLNSVNGILPSASSSLTSTSSYASIPTIGNSLSFMAILIIVLVSFIGFGLIIAVVVYSRSKSASARYTTDIPSTTIMSNTLSSSRNNYANNTVIQTPKSFYTINAPKTCMNCGHSVDTDDIYCFYCGQKQS